ncbi:hypothetical protein MLD38_005455 [Melastoma candidum]|uniref:Uncharacterized protein n=1 Tax=Melastoma candidum TaxID=119954 RepID=A0ACB9RJU5_9MYRT|nr:hypothetical protein MLD38_005455 [Melastoma candidum]
MDAVVVIFSSYNLAFEEKACAVSLTKPQSTDPQFLLALNIKPGGGRFWKEPPGKTLKHAKAAFLDPPWGFSLSPCFLSPAAILSQIVVVVFAVTRGARSLGSRGWLHAFLRTR